ncbi:uncharacterized protein LOC135619148 [Musa acuminata AAA Group]|uniref:uncharacterized protein LOC135619148 n=1 Tax=Musa acuminata AAA Group TaxID=214697 RepID=UPI0031DD1441
MYFEKQSPTGVQRKRRFSSCIPCLLGSPVSDSDASQRPPADARSRRRHSAWYSRCRLRKEEEMTETAQLDASARAAADAKVTTAAKDSLSKKSSAKDRRDSIEQQQEQALRHHTNPRSQHTSLPSISPKYNARRAPIPRSTRTKSKGNEPVTAEHIPGTSSDDSARAAAALEPFVGVGVMVVILAVLVFSGRAAAVVCLCCSLFILHLSRVMSTRPAAAHDEIATREVDMDSDEYKKRVILEGLLQRDGRRSSSTIILDNT